MSVEATGRHQIPSKANDWSYGGSHRISPVSGGSRASEMVPAEYSKSANKPAYIFGCIPCARNPEYTVWELEGDEWCLDIPLKHAMFLKLSKQACSSTRSFNAG
jgi:hypothetical protein